MDRGGNEKRMRVIVIALMLFFLNLSVVIVDELSLYNFSIAAEDKWREEVVLAQDQEFNPDVSVDVATSFGFGDFITGFKNFAALMGRVVFVGSTLKLFGLDTTIANFFGMAVIMIYILGVAQFISNRSTKGMA